jgi:ABC-type sugar transport system ATPase subunit
VTSLLSVHAISKAFPGVQALNGVDFDVRAGEVHALCGENGAGKSTLMRIIAGELRPDSGEIRLRDQPVRLSSPLIARRHGILLLHQEISLVPQLSVAENLYLGALPRGRFGTVDRRALLRTAFAVLEECGIRIDPRAIVSDLTIADRQQVELARAWAFDTEVVIFDEPTASLGEQQAETLFANIERLKAHGVGIVYISHRMGEILRISDRVTVLRDGQGQGTITAQDTSEAAITERMFGRTIERSRKHAPRPLGDEVLRLAGLPTDEPGRLVELSIREGEVLGLYGLVGSGRSELVEAMLGFQSPPPGRLYWRGEERIFAAPHDAFAAGIGFVPEDRRHQGLIGQLPAGANLGMARLPALSRWGLMDRRAERALFGDMSARLSIRQGSETTPVERLSGGNQQKIVLGKWLANRPRLLILDEPTRGVDIAAKAQIYDLIRDLTAEGMAILLISSEVTEIIDLSDRILTFRNGAVTGEIAGDGASEHALAAGVLH